MGKYATGFFLQKGMCAQHHSVLKFSSNYVPTYLLTNLLTYILSSGQEVLGLASAEMPYTLVACVRKYPQDCLANSSGIPTGIP